MKCCMVMLLLVVMGYGSPDQTVNWLAALGNTCCAEESPLLNADQLFVRGHLVDVQIILADKDWKTLCQQTRVIAHSLGKTPAESPFTYFKGEVTIDGVQIKNVGIRKKGFLGSLSNVRPSLKIKFQEYQKQQPIAGIDRLTLNNNQQDRSLASQFLGYHFFNQTGTIAPRSNHARITVNGNYLGIYTNVESVRPQLLKTRFGSSTGDLYEGTVADVFPDTLQRFELKTRKTKIDPLQELARALEETPLDLATLDTMIDIKSFVRYWATESLLGFWDGYTNNQNNFFVYHNPRNSKLYFIPWGLDSAFTSGMPLPPFFIKIKSVHCQSALSNLLYREPKIQQMYRDTLLTLLKDHWNEATLITELDAIEARVGEHLHESQQDFHKSVERIRKFIQKRRTVIENELKEWPVSLSTGPRNPIYFKVIGQATADFSSTWHAETPKNPFKVGKLDLTFSYQDKPLVFKNNAGGVYSELSKDNRGGERSPTVVIIGEREPDGKQIILAVGVPSEAFQPGMGKPVTVQGFYIEGKTEGISAIFARPKLEAVAGFVYLEEASMEPGAPVKGKLELKVLKMTGGKPRPVK